MNCFFDDLLSSKLQFEMLVQPGNFDVVHHIGIYGCHSNMSAYVDHPGDCFGDENNFMDDCQNMFGGWGVGSQVCTVFP